MVVLWGSGMPNPPLNERETCVMELQMRYEYLTSLLGISSTTRSVFRVLHMDNCGWSISGLAKRVNAARSTVRGVVRRNQANGTIAVSEGLVYVTGKGACILVQVQRETFRIALGQQVGFSRRLISVFRDDIGLKIDARSATVCFQKSLPDFVTS